jgi:hypothetical protein
LALPVTNYHYTVRAVNFELDLRLSDFAPSVEFKFRSGLPVGPNRVDVSLSSAEDGKHPVY